MSSLPAVSQFPSAPNPIAAALPSYADPLQTHAAHGQHMNPAEKESFLKAFHELMMRIAQWILQVIRYILGFRPKAPVAKTDGAKEGAGESREAVAENLRLRQMMPL